MFYTQKQHWNGAGNYRLCTKLKKYGAHRCQGVIEIYTVVTQRLITKQVMQSK
jgi:hypothetical protein